MINAVPFIGDNNSWILIAIGVFVLGAFVGLVVFCFGWWQRRETLTIAPKRFSAAIDSVARCRRTNPDTLRLETYDAKLGVNPANLEILFHNQTAIPIILDEINLLNADSGEEVLRQDAEAQRIDAHSSGAVDIRIGTRAAPCYQTPTWHGKIMVKTDGRKSFSSSPFKFADLV